MVFRVYSAHLDHFEICDLRIPRGPFISWFEPLAGSHLFVFKNLEITVYRLRTDAELNIAVSLFSFQRALIPDGTEH
jgi:hypothetical protein